MSTSEIWARALSHIGNGVVILDEAEIIQLIGPKALTLFGCDADLIGEEERAIGIHGGTLETALIRHFRPELVREEAARAFPSAQSRYSAEFRQLVAHGRQPFAWKAQDLSPDGVVGDARVGNAALGRRLAEHQADAFIDLLRDVTRADLAILLGTRPR